MRVFREQGSLGGHNTAVITRPARGRGVVAAIVMALAVLTMPTLPAQAAPVTADDILAPSTTVSPDLGIVKTATNNYVGISLKANASASSITMALVDPGTTNTYSGPFTFSTNGCNNRSLLTGYTCTSNIRFYSATKGSFAADARYTFTSGGVNYVGVISLTATAGTVPGSPTSLSTTILDKTSFRVSWVAPADKGGISLTGYRLNITDPSSNSSDVSLSGSTTSYDITNATLGGTFAFKVYAINALGESAVPAAAGYTFTLPTPTAVTNLQATSRSTSIFATWDTAGGYVDGYKIQIFNKAPGGVTTDVATVSASTTSYTITGLKPANPYTVKVVSYNDSATATATADVTTQRAQPRAPSNVQVTSINATNISLSWTSPVEDVDGYTIEISTDGSTWDEIASPGAAATSATLFDLDPSTRYYIRIAAFNSTDTPDGDFSAAVIATTQSGVTNAVRNFTATPTDEVSVRLQWDAPLPSYVDTTGYRIETRRVAKDGTAGAWTTVDEVDPGTTSYLVDGLIPCVNPPVPKPGFPGCPVTQYRVISVSDWGDSPSSDIAVAEPNFRLSGAASSVTAVGEHPYELTVTWKAATAGTSTIIGYTVFYSDNAADIVCTPNDNGGCDVGGDSIDVGADATSTSISDLEPGTYFVTVVPRLDSQAFGEIFSVMSPRLAATARGEITPVANVRAISVGTTSATLVWDADTSVWDTPLYRVQISTDGGGTWTDVTTTATTTATLTGLRSGASYQAQVIAFDMFTTTEPSDPAEFTMLLAAPVSVSASAAGEAAVDVTWASADPSALVTGWRVETQLVSAGLKPDADSWDEVATVGVGTFAYRASANSCDSVAAPSGFCPVTYFRVVAVNDDIESVPSSAVVGAPNFALPTAPRPVAADIVSATSARVTWGAGTAGTSTTSGYSVYYSTDEADLDCETTDFGGCDIFADHVDVGPSARSATIADLEPGETYYFAVVAAMNSAAFGIIAGSASEHVSIDVPQPITAPENLTLDAYSFRTATVTWDESLTDVGPAVYTVQVSSDGGLTWRTALTTEETTATLFPLQPGTGYRVQVITRDEWTTSDPSEPLDFKTMSYAKPAVPTVTDFQIAGASGGTVAFTLGADTGATGVSYTAWIEQVTPRGPKLSGPCDVETLTCDIPDALPGTGYRILLQGKSDGGIIKSTWFVFTPPAIEFNVTSADVVTNSTVISVTANNLRPGTTAFLTYGKQRMGLAVAADGTASTSFTMQGLGLKSITINQGNRKASSSVWVTGAQSQQTKRRFKYTATVKVFGAAPGAVVTLDASTGESHEVISTGTTITLPIYMSDPVGVSYSAKVDGVELLSGYITTTYK